MNAHYEMTKENKATCEKQSNSCIDISMAKLHILSSDTDTLVTEKARSQFIHNKLSHPLQIQ